MKNTLQNLIGRPAGRSVLVLSLVALLMLSTTPAMAVGNSPTVATNKNTYNIGDPIYVNGTATPNASVEITLRDPGNVTVVVIQAHVASGGTYSTGSLYTLKVTDEAGNWSVVAYDASSNMTAKASFKVVSLWDRISQLQDQISSLQNKIQALNGTATFLNDQVTYLSDQVVILQNDTRTLNSTVASLSSRLSAAEFSAIFAYGAIVISVISIFVSMWAVRKKMGFIPKRRR